MTITQEAIDAAMETIERLGAGGSRTTVRIVLEAAAPHIAAAEREHIRQFAQRMSVTFQRPLNGPGHWERIDVVPWAELERHLLTEGDPDGS